MKGAEKHHPLKFNQHPFGYIYVHKNSVIKNKSTKTTPKTIIYIIFNWKQASPKETNTTHSAISFCNF